MRTSHALAAAVPALLPLVVPLLAGGKTSKEISREVMPAVVQVISADEKGDRLVPVASGSGTILTASGHVLTNHHVIYDKEGGRLYDVAAIALLKAYDEAPELTCLASPAKGVLRADLDLALLKCEADLNGKSYTPSGWPAVPVGNSGELIPGDQVLVFGYPGVGGPTINMTSGHVSGFLGKEGGAGRFWIKTDAAIGHGNSGGTAVDDTGALVGVPTAVRPGEADTGERVGLLRPIALASDLIDLAKKGWEPGDSATTTTTTTTTTATTTENTDSRDEGECPVQEGVFVSGRVVAADNGDDVGGAFVVVLKPGVKRKDIADDYSNIGDHVLAYAVSDSDGRWQTPCPIHRDKTFGVIVVAAGYVELAGDDALSTNDAPDRYQPWGGVVRLQRRR